VPEEDVRRGIKAGRREIRLWQQPQGSRGCLKQRGARISVYFADITGSAGKTGSREKGDKQR